MIDDASAECRAWASLGGVGHRRPGQTCADRLFRTHPSRKVSTAC